MASSAAAAAVAYQLVTRTSKATGKAAKVAVLTLTNPPVNGLSHAVRAGVRESLARASRDGADAAVVVGAGATFPAGADIAEFERGDWAKAPDLGEVVEAVDAARIPVVAAVHGTALGGGLELALACSLRVGSTRARLGLPEPKLGLIPGAGGTQRLPRLVGRGRALDLMLTGREVAAAEAHAIGLLDRVVDPGAALDAAVELATQVAALSLPALEAVLRCVDDAGELSLAEGMAREAARVEDLFDSPDGREGLAAFLAKRPATFA